MCRQSCVLIIFIVSALYKQNCRWTMSDRCSGASGHLTGAMWVRGLGVEDQLGRDPSSMPANANANAK